MIGERALLHILTPRYCHSFPVRIAQRPRVRLPYYFRRAQHLAETAQFDPNVWTGGALQEKSVRIEEFGLASMYPACGAHWAPGHHGGKRACDLISRLASIGLFGSPVLACAGKTVAPFLPFSLADLGGEIGSQVDMFMVLPVFSYFFCSTAPQAFSRPDRGKPRPAREDAVKAGRL